MALSPTMQCFKICGFLCGIISVLNIWFWLGMTIFSAMGNTYLSFGFEGFEFDKINTDDKKFTMIYAIVMLVSDKTSWKTNRLSNRYVDRLNNTGHGLLTIYWPCLFLCSWICSAVSDALDAPSADATRIRMRSSTMELSREPMLTRVVSQMICQREESTEVTTSQTLRVKTQTANCSMARRVRQWISHEHRSNHLDSMKLPRPSNRLEPLFMNGDFDSMVEGDGKVGLTSSEMICIRSRP